MRNKRWGFACALGLFSQVMDTNTNSILSIIFAQILAAILCVAPSCYNTTLSRCLGKGSYSGLVEPLTSEGLS